MSTRKWRAIDLIEGEKFDQAAFKDLLRAAVPHNRSHSVPKSRASRT